MVDQTATNMINRFKTDSYTKRDDVNNQKIAKMSLANTLTILVITLAITKPVAANKTEDQNELVKRMKIIESVSGRFFNDVYENGTFRTGNHLWDSILNQCSVSPSVSCLQKNVYSYMNEKLDFNGDVKVYSGLSFKKNNVDIEKFSEEANIIYLTGSKEVEKERALDEDNEVEDNFEPESPLEEVTDALYSKGVKFLTTHDMRLTLPQTLFAGAVLRVSPRALTRRGALLHVDLEPRGGGEGRLFFNKIKKYIKKKLVTAAIAIILVVKLIALKLVFVLPLILGVTTAKKMFLKLLLFIFPALSHIFKLCSWYHQNYHTTKFHHHHHLITHHHKPQHAPYGHSAHPHSSVVVSKPQHGAAPTFEHYPQDWELSGPGLGSEYLASDIHRNAIANFKPNVHDMNDINAWGLGLPPGPSNAGEQHGASQATQNVATPSGQKVHLGNAGRPIGPPNPYYRNKKVVPKDPLQAEKEALIRAASIAAKAPPSAVRDEILRVSAVRLRESDRVRQETQLVRQQQQILAAEDPETQAAEKFYGNLLEKIDAILLPLGASDPGCRERAVCTLYGDPFKHAPHSNLVSNELSKDSSELIPAAESKSALRYYRYVQAARDGQERRDCVAAYPDCGFDFNQIR